MCTQTHPPAAYWHAMLTSLAHALLVTHADMTPLAETTSVVADQMVAFVQTEKGHTLTLWVRVPGLARQVLPCPVLAISFVDLAQQQTDTIAVLHPAQVWREIFIEWTQLILVFDCSSMSKWLRFIFDSRHKPTANLHVGGRNEYLSPRLLVSNQSYW